MFCDTKLPVVSGIRRNNWKLRLAASRSLHRKNYGQKYMCKNLSESSRAITIARNPNFNAPSFVRKFVEIQSSFPDLGRKSGAGGKSLVPENTCPHITCDSIVCKAVWKPYVISDHLFFKYHKWRVAGRQTKKRALFGREWSPEDTRHDPLELRTTYKCYTARPRRNYFLEHSNILSVL